MQRPSRQTLHPTADPDMPTGDGALHLSIIVPVYNEAENFPDLLSGIEKYAPEPFSVYVVYDFDEDSTVPVAQDLAKTRPWLHLIKNDQGRGVTNALRAGFEAVGSGPAIVMMADLSDDVSILPEMLELYRQGNRIVCPSRYMKDGRQQGGPLVKRVLSRCAGMILYRLAGFPTHDATNNFRLYDAALVHRLKIESRGGFEVSLELTAKAFRRGEPIAELPTIWRDRRSGESQFQLFQWMPRYLYWFFYAFGRPIRGKDQGERVAG